MYLLYICWRTERERSVMIDISMKCERGRYLLATGR